MIFLLIVTTAFSALLDSWGKQEDETHGTEN